MTSPEDWRLVFPVELKAGFIKRVFHVAVVTRDLLVLAQVGDARLQQATALAIQGAKAQGLGYIDQMRAGANSRFALCEDYRTRDLGEIASETPGNPRIPCSQVEAVKYRPASSAGQDADQPGSSASNLLVKTRNGKFDLDFPADRHEQAVVQGLRWVFGDRFR